MRFGCVAAALWGWLVVPAAAQERTGTDYDLEVGGSFVTMWEEGGYTGAPGFLLEGGYGVWAIEEWRAQAIAEFMMVRFDDFEATYKQVAGGVRFARQLSPRARVFGQFQLGIQNDGFVNSNTAFVVMPGGGVTYAVLRQLDAQAMLDVPIAVYKNNTFSQVRFSVGVVLPLGAE
jgi:hypothetical protein